MRGGVLWRRLTSRQPVILVEGRHLWYLTSGVMRMGMVLVGPGQWDLRPGAKWNEGVGNRRGLSHCKDRQDQTRGVSGLSLRGVWLERTSSEPGSERWAAWLGQVLPLPFRWISHQNSDCTIHLFQMFPVLVQNGGGGGRTWRRACARIEIYYHIFLRWYIHSTESDGCVCVCICQVIFKSTATHLKAACKSLKKEWMGPWFFWHLFLPLPSPFLFIFLLF